MSFKKKTISPEVEALLKKAQKKGAKSGPPPEDEGNWLVSYADMMTLLCGFFIMLFSMAKMDEPKYDSFKENVSKQFGGKYESPPKELAKYMTQMMKDMGGMASGAEIKADPLGVSIAFESTVFFDTLSADVSSQGKTVLGKFVDGIAENQKKGKKEYKIVIEGHTDSRPVTAGLYPSNWELSGARASRVVRMFLDKGFDSKNMTAIGYADTHPKYPERTPAGTWDETSLVKNRRVVLRILEPRVDSIPFPEVPPSPQ